MLVALQLVALLVALPRVGGTQWRQDTFAISNWVTPTIEPGSGFGADTERRLAEFAGANFSVLLGTGYFGYQCGKVPWNECLLATTESAERHSLKIVPGAPLAGGFNRTSGKSTAVLQAIDPRISSSPAFWGLQLYDEPIVPVFPALANLSRQIAEKLPGKLRFVNLQPNYAWGQGHGFLGAKNYTVYVAKYLEIMQAGNAGPDVLSTDHYPMFELPPGSNSSTSIAGYRANLGVLRSASLRNGIPFWNFFNVEGASGHPDPTEAQLRWQVFTSLAYGAKGVLYYCYAGQGKGLCGLGGILYFKAPVGQPGPGVVMRGR